MIINSSQFKALVASISAGLAAVSVGCSGAGGADASGSGATSTGGDSASGGESSSSGGTLSGSGGVAQASGGAVGTGGTGGADPCSLCGVGETCLDGTCYSDSTCNPATCPTGCCDEVGTCILPVDQNWLACGGGGLACAGCSWGVVCGADQMCTTEIDPKADFLIHVSALSVQPTPVGGTEWDPFGGLPDLFVCFSDGTSTGCTTKVDNAASANWIAPNDILGSNGLPVSFSGAAIIAGNLTFSVWDYDPSSSDELIGSGAYSSGIVTKNASETASNIGNVISLTWSLD